MADRKAKPRDTKKDDSDERSGGKPVSLAPLDFELAVEGLLGVKTETKKAAKPKAKAKKKAARKKKGG